MNDQEQKALTVLRDAFYTGSPHVTPRRIGYALNPKATPLGAGKLGGRVASSLVRQGMALRSTPSWDNNPKSPYYRITTSGREVAATTQ